MKHFFKQILKKDERKKRRQQFLQESKKRLIDTNLGRSEGWIVELNNKPIAEFLNPENVDQSMYNYDLVILDKSLSTKLITQQFWIDYDSQLRFYSKALNEYSNSSPIIIPQIRDNKGKTEYYIWLRYLYIGTF